MSYLLGGAVAEGAAGAANHRGPHVPAVQELCTSRGTFYLDKLQRGLYLARLYGRRRWGGGGIKL